MKNKMVVTPPSQPCGTIRVTLGNAHTRLVKQETLRKHGWVMDNERGLLVRRVK